MKEPDDLKENCTTFDQLIAPIMTKVAAIEASRSIHHWESLTFAAFFPVTGLLLRDAGRIGTSVIDGFLECGTESGTGKGGALDVL